MILAFHGITKTRLFKYIEILQPKKKIFRFKKNLIFSYFCSKHRLWVLVRTASPPRRGGSHDYLQSMVLANKKNNVYPCKLQFHYIKVGFKGVKITQACFRNGYLHLYVS